MLGAHGIGSPDSYPTFTDMMNFIPVFPLALVAFQENAFTCTSSSRGTSS